METSTLLFVGLLSAVALAGATLWFLNRRGAAEESRLHCRCTCCGQKMRFNAARTGKAGQCPRCGHAQLLQEQTDEGHRSPVRVGQPLRGQTTARSLR